MPWVRIDENAMDHPKFLALSDGALRLWLEGLAYCQKHLTDGVILLAALRGFRYFSPAKMKALTTPCAPDARPLWALDGQQVLVHDYLDWNDSRAAVMAAREAAKKRQQDYRHRPRNAVTNENQTAHSARESLSGVRGVRSFSPEQTPYPQAVPSVPDDLAMRAGRFVEKYAELHEKYRRGARYLSRPVLDFQEALQLVGVWDDERLAALAQAFLVTDDEWVSSGPRTLARFRSRASWCEDKLLEAGLLQPKASGE